MFLRQIETKAEEYLKNSENHKIFFIWGPRRSGKTTVLKKLSQELNVPIFNFDWLSDQEKFVPNRENLQKIVASCPVILIDEVQNHPEATIALKILVDHFAVKIIATGSSELRQKTKNFDSLAGRFTECYCLPLSFFEIAKNNPVPAHEEKNKMQNWLEHNQIFGAYPEVASAATDSAKIEILQNILDTYVLKDIIALYDLRNAKLAKDILTKIALQIGQEVSLRELANSTGATATTVNNYIEIFIKNYILIPVPSFKTNARKAVSSHKKFYFLDLGLRNILVRDFRSLNLRPDQGNVFENLLAIETWKKIKNDKLNLSLYFYREYSGQEVDFVIEDYYKNYHCFESKLQTKNIPAIFPLAHKLTVVTPQNIVESIAGL